MAFQVSPGVNISEIDASSNVPAVATSIGGIVGQFSKGPVSEIVEISSEDELVAVFGEPNDTNYRSWFSAANFLSYSSSIKIVRVVDHNNATVVSRARNALAGKVTASSSTSGSVQNFTGAAESATTIVGSSAQNFTQTVDGAVSQLDLHIGVDLLASGADAATTQYLLPRLNNAAPAALVVANGTVASTDVVQRNLIANDLSITIGKVGQLGGLLPTDRYSLNSTDNVVSLTDAIGSTSGNAGPVYVHSHDAADNYKLSTVGTNPGTTITGVTSTAMGSGFTWPLYTRFQTAALVDSSTYGGTGSVHGHVFAKYEITASSANTVSDADASMLSVGDTILLADGTLAYIQTLTSDTTNTVIVAWEKTDAGSEVTIPTTLNKVFYMPNGTSANPAGPHASPTAPADISIKPYANGRDEIKLSVVKRSKFTLAASPGSHAVTNNLVSISGSLTTNDFSVTANSTTVSFLNNNAPETPTQTDLSVVGDFNVVTVPARKSFPLNPVVDITSGQTIDITVNSAAVSQGTGSANYQLLDNGSRIEFITAVTTGHAITATLKNKLANSFEFGNTEGTNLLIKNDISFGTDLGFAGSNANGHEFAARSAGSWGDTLHVYLVDESSYSNFLSDLPGAAGSLSGAPRADDATIDVAAVVPINSEPVSQGISLVVVNNGVVVETIEHMSKAGNGKSSDGRSLYYVDVINNTSQFVFCLNHPNGQDWGANIVTNGTSLNPTKTGFTKLQQDPSVTVDGTEEYISRPFGNGYDGVMPATTHYEGGYDLFNDAENIDVSFLMQGESAENGTDAAAAGIIGHIIDICEARKDCIACISPRYSDVLADKNDGNSDNTIAFMRTVRKSNYAFADSNFKYVSDKYNNKFRWVPFNADTAGLMVKSELDRDAWFSPAGLNRGVYRGVVKTLHTQTKSDRDALYKEAINPVVNFAGQGTILFGDKTFTMRPSAFSRINVRRLFIVLEKAIATAAKFTLFEFNDEFTRAQFTALIEPFLREIKGRRGIFDFKVVADSSNNTQAVIDSNQFVGDIFIQPARSINFIQLNFVAVNTGVSFDEIVGSV